MKISDNLTTTSGMHVFETPEDLIINSQVYDKFSMEVKPYNFFNIDTFLNKNLLLQQINILEYPLCNTDKELGYKYYIQDNKDSSIFYCLLEIGKSDQNQYLHKIQKKNDKYTLLKSISPDSGYRVTDSFSTFYHYKILGQTDEYIIIYQKCGSGATSSTHIYGYYGAQSIDYPSSSPISLFAIKKSDFSVKYVNIGINYDEHIQCIQSYSDYVILYYIENGRTVKFAKYLPANNTLNIIFTKQYIPDSNRSPLSNIILFNEKYYIMMGSSMHRYFFVEFNINFATNEVTDKTINIDDCSIPLIDGDYYNNNLYDNYLRFSLKNVDNTYIALTVHNKTNGSGKHYHSYVPFTYYGNGAYGYTVNVDDNIFANNKHHRHYLFKKTNNIFKQKTFIQPSTSDTQFIYGVLYFDDYTLILFFKTGIEIYRFDLENESYNKVFESNGTFQTIGLDENNNFYTFDVNNNCKIYNKATCSTIQGDFEFDSYNYNGVDITTHVTISSRNFIGETISSKINVELSGNCHFLNDKQKAILNTYEGREYQVPVIINGPGIVYCNINEVE